MERGAGGGSWCARAGLGVPGGNAGGGEAALEAFAPGRRRRLAASVRASSRQGGCASPVLRPALTRHGGGYRCGITSANATEAQTGLCSGAARKRFPRRTPGSHSGFPSGGGVPVRTLSREREAVRKSARLRPRASWCSASGSCWDPR